MIDDPRNVEHMISEINSNMPVNRRTLSDYLDNGDYTYLTRSGIIGNFDKEELDYLSSICTEVEKLKLRLPLFISTDTLSEHGAWKIEGKIEVSVISKVLNKHANCEDYIQLHYPDLVEVRHKLPNLVVVLFLP